MNHELPHLEIQHSYGPNTHVALHVEGGLVFPAPVLDQGLPGTQAAPLFFRGVTGHLDCPCFSEMRHHPSAMHFPSAAPMQEQDHGVIVP